MFSIESASIDNGISCRRFLSQSLLSCALQISSEYRSEALASESQTVSSDLYTNDIFNTRRSVSSFNVQIPQPLEYVTPKLVKQEVSIIVDNLRKAAVPSNIDGFIAMSAADAIAGAVGALLSRKVADIVGDKKRDTTLTKVLTTGSFFGTRGIARAGFQLLGFPRPIAIFFSSIFASLISEEAKFLSRKNAESSNLANSSSRTLNNISETLSFREISSDISKWLIYDGLIESSIISETGDFRYFAFGSISAIFAFFVKESPFQLTKVKGDKDYGSKIAKSALEGGVLFLFYAEFLEVLEKVVPDELNRRFLFNSVIEDLEADL
jgi:hypothetical protein